MHWLYFILIGILAGFLAGKVMRGKGFGLLGDLIIGIIGSVFGGWVLGVIGLSFGGLIGALFTAFVGACLLLFLIRLIAK